MNGPGIRFGLAIGTFLGIGVAVVIGTSGVSRLEKRPSDSSSSLSREERWSFYSPALDRTMPVIVLLPPGYDAGDARYPTLYMLHGLSGTNEEWLWYGIRDESRRLMVTGKVPPFIIVLPQGDDGYWVDHANGGPRWGVYVAADVVKAIDSSYRTIARPEARAVGGLSMGADGALQLSLNHPHVFGIAGAHSPVLRAYETAPSYFGDEAYYHAHAPLSLLEANPAVARSLVISLDVGEADLWLPEVLAFHQELDALGISHVWNLWPGEHNAAYWSEHVEADIIFYGNAFARIAIQER